MNFLKVFLYTICFLIFLVSCRTVNNEKLPENTLIDFIKSKSVNQILVCAHRSFHKNAPENSILSIKHAIDSKIDIVEIDIRTTKDSVLVLMHDASIDRTTNGKGLLSHYTYKNLLNFSLKHQDSLTNQKIPTLNEVLDLVKEKIILNLDLKAVNYKQLYDLLQKHDMQHEVISFIGKKSKVQDMISIDSLFAVLPLSKTIDDINFYSENTTSSLQHFTEETYNEALIKIAKNKNQLIFINTLWDEDVDIKKGNFKSVDSIIALRPAIIQTDYPLLLLNYLISKNLHH